MSAIGDLFLKVLADMKGFETEVVKGAEKAGDKAGQTLGQRMSKSIKQHGAQILGTGLAAGFAVATKGLLELERVTADFAAETGASADEANRAGKAINAMAGRNIQPLAEVGAALTKVHTDLGLTGEEAEKTTEQFLKFGRATKQDAASAVSAFDDILDAWGLTAQEAGGIMDKLVVSHQKYGGSIEDNQRSLAELAPALKAANLNVDDGIGLLNLFEASGVDSAVAVTGMTKALTKVKSPEELKKLIADIIATEDPFLRAQKASDLFGAKAGAKLANALRPGSKGLDDFTISVEESAGATQKAADVLDSTFGARFQLLLKGAGAALIGFGSNFGPALTGMASFASLAGALGGGKLLGGLAAVLKKGGVRLAAALGVSFGSAVVSGAAESGGETIGNLTTKAIQKRLAGRAASNVMAKGLETGLIGLETALPVKSGMSRLGTFLGSTVGKAFSLGFAAAAVVALVQTFSDVTAAIRNQTEQLAKQTGEFAKTATTEALINARKGVAEQLEAVGHDPIAEALGLSARKGIEDTLGSLDAEIKRRTDAAAASFAAGEKNIGASGAKMEGTFIDVGAKARAMATTILTGVQNIKTWVAGLRSTLVSEARAMIDGYYDPIIAQQELLVAKDEAVAAQRAMLATKAGTAERRQADLTLANSRKNLEQTRVNLLAAGTLSKKEQAAWLTELQAKYRTATGAAKTRLGELIAKIKEVERVGSTVPINIIITGLARYAGKALPGLAHGGPALAGHIYAVNEDTPRTEFFAPNVSGQVLTHAQGVAAIAAGGDTIYQLGISGVPLRAETPAEVVAQLRRAARIGAVKPPRTPPTWDAA